MAHDLNQYWFVSIKRHEIGVKKRQTGVQYMLCKTVYAMQVPAVYLTPL